MMLRENTIVLNFKITPIMLIRFSEYVMAYLAAIEIYPCKQDTLMRN